MTTDAEHLNPAVQRPISTDGRIQTVERITTGVFAAIMTLSGVLYLIGPKLLITGLLGLGYPLYFLKMLGVAKLLGVIGILQSRWPTLQQWAYAGFTFDLVAAVISHTATGTASHALPPLILLAVLAASYLLRRHGRATLAPSRGAA
jgi:hypothetical protein